MPFVSHKLSYIYLVIFTMSCGIETKPTSARETQSASSTVNAIFKRYDVDKDGTLTRREWSRMIDKTLRRDIRNIEQAPLLKDELMAEFLTLDVNEDDHISYEEYRSNIEKNARVNHLRKAK